MGRTRARYRYANECVILDQRTGSGSPPLAHSPLHTKVTRGGATLLHKTNNPIPDGVISLWSDSCSMSIRVWTQTVVPWRNPGGLVCTPRDPSHPKVVKIFGKHASAVSHTFVQPIDCLVSNPRPSGSNRVSGTFATWYLCLVAFREVNLLPYIAGRPNIYPCLHL